MLYNIFIFLGCLKVLRDNILPYYITVLAKIPLFNIFEFIQTIMGESSVHPF
jgi:hypothetical protein